MKIHSAEGSAETSLLKLNLDLVLIYRRGGQEQTQFLLTLLFLFDYLLLLRERGISPAKVNEAIEAFLNEVLLTR